jgi:recombination protein RecR
MKIPQAIQKLTDALERLPGIGPKTAARLAFYLLHVPEAERQRLGQAVLELGEGTGICPRCFNITDKSEGGGEVFCDICRNGERDAKVICVVEDPLDVMAFERAGRYSGLYHVLHGVIAPLEHVGPEDLKISELMKRLASPVEEIILATNPSLEGEATAMYIRELISKLIKGGGSKVRVTRIARGIPTGGDLEYADSVTLIKSLEGRQNYLDGQAV